LNLKRTEILRRADAILSMSHVTLDNTARLLRWPNPPSDSSASNRRRRPPIAPTTPRSITRCAIVA